MPALKKLNKRARGILGSHRAHKTIDNLQDSDVVSKDIDMDNNCDRPLGCLNTQPFEMQYNLGSHIGEGGFGKVYSAVRIRDGKQVAVKQVARTKVPTWGVVSTTVIKQSILLQCCF